MRIWKLCKILQGWHCLWLSFWLLLSRFVNQREGCKFKYGNDILFSLFLETISLSCKDTDSGTSECEEADSTCLVKRVGNIFLNNIIVQSTLLYEMPSNLKGKNFVSKFPGYCPQNTMAFFSSKLDGIKK